jgi:hypothetical protein
MKLPAIQFYTGDWRKDPGIQALDFETRGIWFEMLCLMSESPERGKLTLNGKAMPLPALAKILGIAEDLLNLALTKLLTYGVAGQEDETGIIFNRRMIRDEDIRKKRADAGKLGGNPVLLNHRPTKAPSKVEPLHVNETETVDEVLEGVRGAGERGDVGCTIEEALAYARTGGTTIIPDACAQGWHEDRSRAEWHYPKSKKLFPLPPGKMAWQNDLRIFSRNWQACEAERKAGASTANGTTPFPAKPEGVWQLKQRLEAIDAELGKLNEKAMYDGWSKKMTERRQELREAKADLNGKLSGLEATA